MAHTPGPWSVGDDQLVVWSDVITVAEARRSRADARLIAAAPELLEVAKKLAAWESDPDGYGGDLAEIGCMARAAIAKAEGKGE